MHLTIAICVLILNRYWGDWQNWQRYHTTMLFAALCNLFYSFVYTDHLLWILIPDFSISPKAAEMFFGFITLPGTALLFLSNYPIKLSQQVARNALFIAVYIVLEWLGLRYGKVIHAYGWTIWHSLAWDVTMFPMFVIHHKKPLLAYLLSIIYVAVVVWFFPVDWLS